MVLADSFGRGNGANERAGNGGQVDVAAELESEELVELKNDMLLPCVWKLSFSCLFFS